MAKKRKARDKEQEVNLLEPIDINKFGTEDDVCFGKHYNLAMDECKRCGDSELCGVVFSQTASKKARKKVEKKTRFKDLELGSEKALEGWVKNKLDNNTKRFIIIKKAMKTFGCTKDEVKSIIKENT